MASVAVCLAVLVAVRGLGRGRGHGDGIPSAPHSGVWSEPHPFHFFEFKDVSAIPRIAVFVAVAVAVAVAVQFSSRKVELSRF